MTLSPEFLVVSWPAETVPTELIIEIVLYSKFTLYEFIEFTNLCRAFRELRKEQIAWVDALTNHQARSFSLVTPIGTDLTKLNLEELVDIGMKSWRQYHSWFEGEPSFREMRSLDLPFLSPAPPAILSVVPMTGLVFRYLEDEPSFLFKLEVCDMDVGYPIAGFNLGSKIIRHAHYDMPGKHLIALATESTNALGGHHSFNLRIFSLQYGLDREPSLECIYAGGSAMPTGRLEALYITRDCVGEVLEHPESYSTKITSLQSRRYSHSVWSFKPNDQHLTPQTHFQAIVTGNEVFFVTDKDGECNVYHLPSERLPSSSPDQSDVSGTLDLDKIISVKTVLGAEEYYDMEAVDFDLSPSGLQTMAISYSASATGTRSMTTFNAWYPSQDENTFFRQKANEEQPRVLCLPGKVGSHSINIKAPWLFASSRSGLYKVMIFYPDERFDSDNASTHPSLTLLRFDPIHKQPPSSCALDIPTGVHLDEVYSIGLDERRGVVYLSLVDGNLVELSYA